MENAEFLRRQKERVVYRLEYTQIVINNRRADTLHKRKNVLPAQLKALEKLERGTYFLCEDCGGDIPQARLRVVPAAIRCLQCQNDLEKK